MLSLTLKMFVFVAVLALAVDGAPQRRQTKTKTSSKLVDRSESKALDYLEKYGYLGKPTKTKMAIKDKKTAIAEFQKMAGLKSTGQLTPETLTMMEKPRCGVSDSNRSRNYVAISRWPKKHLTYFISKYPASRLNRQQVDQEIARALQVWSDHTDLTFRVVDRQRDQRPDIDIKFEVYDHGDGSSFDGSGGTLAHAFFPTEGKAHFDDSEAWTVYDHNGINLFQVAAHEFGHSLGLDHSQVRTALMAPFYQGYQPTFRLDNDDIQGIQHLYGQKTNQGAPAPPPNPPPRPRPPPATPATPTYPGGWPGWPFNGGQYPSYPQEPTFDNSLCKDMTFDTIFTDLQGVTYVIKGSKYWMLGSINVAQDVQRKWPGLPPKIDAAFSHREMGKTYFFSGAQFWRYQGDRLDQGYPKLISQSFPRIPDNLDAAFVWPRNNQIYFFKGSEFWKFDYTTLPAVASVYPRQTGAWWRGVADAPDAAFSRGGLTHFAKDGSYARILDDSLTMDSSGYRPVGVLFGCPNANKVATNPKVKFWMAGIMDRPVPKNLSMPKMHSEHVRRPNHSGCMKHRECKKFP